MDAPAPSSGPGQGALRPQRDGAEGAAPASAHPVLTAVGLPTAVVALAFAAILTFSHLGSMALIQPDEGRNAEVAREMSVSGDWLVPTFDGLTYLDKPAFYFALVAVSLRTFGVGEAAARFPSALFGFLLVILIFGFCRRQYKDGTAPFAALVLASAPMFLVFARSVIFDMTLAFFMTASIFAGFEAESASGGRRRAWYALGAAAAGLGTLVKGPVGFLIPALVLTVFFLIDRTPRAILRLLHPLNLLVFAAIVFPWFFALVGRHPEFLQYGLVKESIERFTKPVFERAGPPWYYIPVIVAALFPWSLLFPESIHAWWQARSRLARPDRLLVVWSATVFVFFSLSTTKHRGYVLPAVVSLSILLARPFALAAGAPSGRAAAAVRRSAGLLLVAALVLGGLFSLEAMRPGTLAATAGLDPDASAWLDGSALAEMIGALLLIALLAAAAVLRRAPRLAFASFLALPLFLVTVFGDSLGDYAAARSHRALAARLAHLAGGAEIACVKSFPSGAPFYLGRTLTLLSEDGSELRSNYVVYALGNRASWPAPIVPLRDRAAWLAGRRSPVFLLADASAKPVLTEILSTRGLEPEEIVPGWWGAMLPPSLNRPAIGPAGS